jgi:hypothetical protein
MLTHVDDSFSSNFSFPFRPLCHATHHLQPFPSAVRGASSDSTGRKEEGKRNFGRGTNKHAIDFRLHSSLSLSPSPISASFHRCSDVVSRILHNVTWLSSSMATSREFWRMEVYGLLILFSTTPSHLPRSPSLTLSPSLPLSFLLLLLLESTL